MNNSKLIQLIKSLSAKELKRLRKFVYSPYHNEHHETTLLFEYIYKTAPRFMHTRLDKNRVFQALYPQQALDDQQMRLIMSYLLKIVESFLVIENNQQHPLQEPLNLLKNYRQKDLDKHFNGVLRIANDLQKKEKHQDATFFLHQFTIEREVQQYIEAQHNRQNEPNLQKLSDSLDAFYLIHKLKTACMIMNYKNIMQTEYQMPFINQILDHLAQNNYTHIPAIAIYYHALLTLTQSEEEQHFRTLKELILSNLTKFPIKELQDMFVLARNYCIKTINTGNREYINILFDLYKTEIAEGILAAQELLPPPTYNNIVSLGLNQKAFDWTENFIQQYKDKLPEEFRESIFLFNLAKLNFTRKQYDKVIPLLHQLAYSEVFLALNAKIMLLKTYYELDEDESLYSLLDSTVAFLKRKQKVSYHRQNYLNFIKMVKKLLKLNPFESVDVSTLQTDIRGIRYLVERQWLLEKAAEFGKK